MRLPALEIKFFGAVSISSQVVFANRHKNRRKRIKFGKPKFSLLCPLLASTFLRPQFGVASIKVLVIMHVASP
jgi:hypothetical protein